MTNEAPNKIAIIDPNYIVICHAVDTQAKPAAIRGLRIQAYDQDPRSPHDPIGGVVTTDDRGEAIIRFKQSDFTEHPGEEGPDIYFKIYRGNTELQYTLPNDKNDEGVLRKFKPRRDPITIQIEKHYVVEGHILQQNGLPARDLQLYIYNRGFADSNILLGNPTTDEQGHYVLTYNPQGRAVNLEIRIKDPVDSSKEIALSKTKFSARGHEVLNLIAPGTSTKAEYQRLAEDLTNTMKSLPVPAKGLAELVNVQENSERKDLTFLYQATGWDARLIAFAATAEKLKADSDLKTAGFSADILYALVRVGLPSNKQQLAQLSVQTIESALKKAKDANIAQLTDAKINAAKRSFERFSQAFRLTIKAPGAVSSIGDLLNQADLEAEERNTFTNIYLSHRGTPDELWQKAKESFTGSEGEKAAKVDRLKLQGKLAYLTFNNAELIQSITENISSSNQLEQLVTGDFHKPEAWETQIKKLAGTDQQKLKDLIPPIYTSDKVDENLKAYAADLARKVRLSFPTQIVSHMVQTKELSLGKDHDVLKDDVKKFLNNAQTQNYELGRASLDALIRNHADTLFQGINQDRVEATKDAVKQLHRLYQVTPTDQALVAISNAGFTSASDIIDMPFALFLRRFRQNFPIAEEERNQYEALIVQQADLTYRKSQQVDLINLSVLTMAQTLDSSPPVFALSGTLEQREAARESARAALIQQFPTLETVMGTSFDFCECEHCRSVLSPAAYFVDLLQFLEPGDMQWDETVEKWKNDYDGAPYPFKSQTELETWQNRHPGQELLTEEKPFEILNKRRPDLAHLPLTCENTHTALPYIDVVNEILEYYVASSHLDNSSRLDNSRSLDNFKGYDTEDATTPELLAEPQNVLPKAYTELIQQKYPITLPFDISRPVGEKAPLALPFDLPLETVRQFCNHFDTPLWQLLETFRTSDDLFSSDGRSFQEGSYYRAAIFAEYLGLSPAEYEIFTDQNFGADPLQWYELFGYQDSENVITQLTSAKLLSERLGVSYVELAALIETWFVNPNIHSDALVALNKLGVTAEEALLYREYISPEGNPNSSGDYQIDALNKAYEQHLEALGEKYNFDYKAWVQTYQNSSFDRIILWSSSESCNFSRTRIQYLSGVRLKEFDFLKLSLFVRLWRQLGWTIEDTDRALKTFIPKDLRNNLTSTTLGVALKTALLYISHLKALSEKVKPGRNSLQKLMTLWSDLPIQGKKPLYSQLFLTQSILKNDPVFDHPLGQYLSQDLELRQHLFAVQGALGLTANEIQQVLEDDHQNIDQAKLTLENVSLLYRYSLLAKSLKLSIEDLISLRNISGINPFEPLSSTPIQSLESDHPFEKTLRFIEVSEKIKASNFKIEDLDYLLCHHIDPVGKYRSEPEAVLTLLRTIATGIQAIRQEHTFPTDVSQITFDFLRQKLTLILPPDAVETFFEMLDGTVTYTAPVNQAALQQGDFANESSVQIVYDSDKQPHLIVVKGVLFEADRVRLENGKTDSVKELLKDVQQQAEIFFEGYLLKQTISSKTSIGFLDIGDFDFLFQPSTLIDENLPEQEKDELRFDNEKLMRDKLKRVAQAFLPYLQRVLMHQFVIQAMAENLNADGSLIEMLFSDIQLLKISNQPDQSLPDAFLSTETRGIDAVYYASTDNSGTPLKKSVVSSIDTLLKEPETDNLILPRGTNSIQFEGCLQVPTAGFYHFYAVCGSTTQEVELNFGHLSDPLLKGKVASDGEEISDALELRPNIPYRFVFTVQSLNSSDIALLVQGENLPKGSLDRFVLYPESHVKDFEHDYELLKKTLHLLQGLNLDEREIKHILLNKQDFADIDLRQLPLQDITIAQQEFYALVQEYLTDPRNPLSSEPDRDRAWHGAFNNAAQKRPDLYDQLTLPAKLFAQFLRLVNYVQLKQELSIEGTELIDIFEQARRSTTIASDITEAKEALLQDVCDRFAKLTRRTVSTVLAVAKYLGFTASDDALEVPGFLQEKGLQRLWDILKVTEKLGVPVDSIASWRKIVAPLPANAPSEALENFAVERMAIADEFRNMVKARYEPASWLQIAQPIFDKLRQRKRDALVAYILHKEGFESINQLFEYFLVDPGMEPVVQTSRVRLAISSVQLFIQRCLLNLEPFVDPSQINSQHWQWMKRYRVWEANRKIFLYPENWLEPEFRDDKTHLFQELESALLQGDVSNDLAEDAFFTYLKGLEQIARLEMVTMYLEEKPGVPGVNILHVIGRTYNQPHKYFYRRYAHQMWPPWEPVTMDIEGDHIVAVVWKQRLNLFWVTFLPKDKEKSSSNTKVRDIAEQNLSEASESTIRKEVEVQLNWTEYFQGQWTTRTSSGFGEPIVALVDRDFNPSNVFIHVTKEYERGEERGARIHLSGANFTYPVPTKIEWEEINPDVGANLGEGFNFGDIFRGANPSSPKGAYRNLTSFRIISKNSPPSVIGRSEPPVLPYTKGEVNATRYEVSGPLQVIFSNSINLETGEPLISNLQPQTILGKGHKFSLLACSEFSKLTPEDTGILVGPIFYQDAQNTFFIEPILTEEILPAWPDYVLPSTPPLDLNFDDDWWERLPLDPRVPILPDFNIPGWLDPIDPTARFGIETQFDWATDPSTLILFDEGLVGQGGGFSIDVLPVDASAISPEVLVENNLGINLANGNRIPSDSSQGLANNRGSSSVNTTRTGRVNVVGNNGLNQSQLNNLSARGAVGFNLNAVSGIQFNGNGAVRR